MKIVLIMRDPAKNGYSIEMLFNLLGQGLRAHAEVAVVYWRGWRQLGAFLREIRTARGDIYHISGDVNFVACLLPRGRTVLTIHDIDHYHKTLSGWRKWVYRWLWFDIPIFWANQIVAVSETTARLVKKEFHLSADKITIIENFISPAFSPSPKKELGQPPTILQVGTAQHKNLLRLIRALSGRRARLVIIGPISNQQERALKESGVDFTNLVGLSTDEVVEQYRISDIVAFASLHEGYGLPIVEGQAIGRPVITSNRPPMSDVAGDAAFLINPESEASYREAISSLLTDADLRAELVRKGLRNADRFSLEANLQAHLKLYRSMVKARRKAVVSRVW